jgi:hypothetical protein
MRFVLSALLLSGSLGSCAFFSEGGFEPVQHNVRLTANVTYPSDLDIEGPAGSANTEFDEESYQAAIEWEDANGFAPYLMIGRGGWTFDWPGEVDFLRWSAGARWYGGELGEEGSWFDNTRAYGDLGISILDPDPFRDAQETHRFHSGISLNASTGLQRHLQNGTFFELGLLASVGQMNEVVRNTVFNVSAENDWDWYHVMLVIGVGRRF